MLFRLTLALTALRRHATRTALAVLGVAVACAMLLDMVMLSSGMRESFRELLLSKGYQLRLSPKGTLPFDSDATIAGASGIITTLRANPDIVNVSPVLGAALHVPRAERTITSFGLGIDPTQQADYELIAGRDLGAPNTMVARIGDTLAVATGYDPQLRTYAGRRMSVITGEAKFLYMGTDQLAAALPLATLQAMHGDAHADRVSLFMLKARPSANVDAVRQWIETRIPRVTVISTSTAIAQLDERLSYFRQLAFILGAVSLVVGFLLVTTVMTVSVNERVGEISVMRAIGVSTPHVVQQIVLEGIVITGVGAALGLGLGLVTGRFLNGILSDFPGLPAAIDFFLFQPSAAFTALGLMTLTGILAGIYPAWRASSRPIATTLRREAIA
jgi:putative ABC transport system permease protein